MSALLSSTFWLLLNTPMVPPEPKTRTKSVPMVDLNRTKSKRSRRSPSTSSVDSDVSSVDVAVSDTDAPAS
ncbi:uncharacterized protein TRAVEDRAFT_46860 [Trametes versicolor FP-101664 SS1]|uniref:uncharacterized protein n=1 Tax=Trametes versicolor (strain FP-101664) TaxID=717944 RepID=UPI00046212B9|nr:uncharacterized protein TRAVEDRAFT_46860 [Trametes versicolor FP-101664 SS1]EIW59557.1 hypothetical protein TRAVEDRAFT_46860 [Trametes versicolor FP-101664 SS1]